ncbi:MAG: 2-oxoacid:acceptor oxidoreductase family protein [Anaerolineae bacterium]|nr:2-oxoacid:acceptor oxidoreductase family protein [Anaerolineae bacterium]
MIAERVHETYLDEATLPFPFCPGCGHSTILTALNEALVQLQPDPHQVVIVSDIGCQGLSDKFFTTNAFHGLHGRSVTYASGIKLAQPDLNVIVLIGDGGCGIGGHHLLNAARRNIGLTVIVFNNLNFGMTGGEHSVTSPPGALTVTTQLGNLEQPLDICGTVATNGANFVARTTTFDKTLPDLLAQAIRADGFALVDIWELCTAYFAPNNQFKRASLDETLAALNFPTGIIQQNERAEYSRAYRAATVSELGRPVMEPQGLTPEFTSDLAAQRGCVIAGAAGQKIVTAASALAQGAILSGLWASQHNDYPVTVKTGHSVAEVTISPKRIRYIGIEQPEIMVVLFPEGLRKEQARIAALPETATLYIEESLLPVQTQARVVSLDFSATKQQKGYWAIMALAEVLRREKLYPLAALRAAVSLNAAYAEKNLAALDASEQIIVQA